MPRRVSLPGAAELFRGAPSVRPSAPEESNGDHHPVADESTIAPAEPASTGPPPGPPRTTRGSGRVRHDEKITVYVSSDELLELERARLTLRAEHGMAVDRGRIVREALALVIGDMTERGADSELVKRLSQP
jgi:hypothetical protein